MEKFFGALLNPNFPISNTMKYFNTLTLARINRFIIKNNKNTGKNMHLLLSLTSGLFSNSLMRSTDTILVSTSESDRMVQFNDPVI